jgi:ketosteroid isomerase-like protein
LTVPTQEDAPGVSAEAEELVRRFAEAWAAPAGDRLAALAHPEVVLVQPLLPTTHGRAGMARGFERLFGLLPDMRGDVVAWSAHGPVLFIQLRLRATVARRPFEWEVVDRIVLEDGMIRERVSYFDPLPLLLEGLKRPSRLPRLVRLLLGR